MPKPATVADALTVLREHYGRRPDGAAVAPLGRGLINDTFAVGDHDGCFVLQRVNPVFDAAIHHNIVAVTEHLAAVGMATPRVVPSSTGAPYLEHEGRVWRMMTREPGVSVDAVGDPRQAHAAAALLARFHGALADLDHEFVGLRSGVHDTPAHLRRLGDAVAEHREHRLYDRVAALADEIAARAQELPPLVGLPERIVHGDPKLNNVLFTKPQQGPPLEARCWIDLDTIAPMPLAVELGDAWRSWCNPRGEDEVEGHFDLAVFEASLVGYAEAGSLPLSVEERQSLVYGVEWITLELAARFAADALREAYFGWDRGRFPAAGEHNLVRAQGQWSLHQVAVKLRSERESILRRSPLPSGG